MIYERTELPETLMHRVVLNRGAGELQSITQSIAALGQPPAIHSFFRSCEYSAVSSCPNYSPNTLGVAYLRRLWGITL
jgi:hypothetical protein